MIGDVFLLGMDHDTYNFSVTMHATKKGWLTPVKTGPWVEPSGLAEIALWDRRDRTLGQSLSASNGSAVARCANSSYALP